MSGTSSRIVHGLLFAIGVIAPLTIAAPVSRGGQPTAGQPPAGQPPAGQPPMPEFVRQAEQLVREGHLDQALAVYKQELAATPSSFEANVRAGVVLDFMGQTAAAREYLTKALAVAETPQAKSRAARSIAISYAFDGNCDGAVKYEGPLYNEELRAGHHFNAGEIADELARICVDSGSLDTAERWYRMGYAAGMQEKDIKPERKDLWDFRWEHATARIEARRGHKEEAERHVQLAKAALDKGTNPDQAQFFPYLTGYVALYTGDYKTAAADLQQSNQKDPFILVLLGEATEKLGNRAQAMEYYKSALGIYAHNPPGACSRAVARKKLAQS